MKKCNYKELSITQEDKTLRDCLHRDKKILHREDPR